MDNQVEEIKNRLDIVEFIRGYMKLEKSGANFRGLCPFHHEKTPSLFVSPTRQIWKCFGCSVGGDIFSFVEQIEGAEFKEALSVLAERAGVKLHSFNPKERSEKSRLYEVLEKACQFYEKQFRATRLGNEAKEYLAERGLADESLAEFRVGFAPASRNSTVEFLRSLGYSPSEVFKTGLSIQPDGGGYGGQTSPYDRFRGRIMFPICDTNGQVIGFGGRVFFAKGQAPDDKLAKYINTPQTLLYDKSKVLYGLDRAKLDVRAKDSAIIVEGYTDVIMSHQAGTKNVISVSGTALTDSQLDLVKRYTDNIITCFDMDVAGSGATTRGIDLALNKGFNVKVVTFPDGKDPAEIIQHDKKKWCKAVEKPISIGDFYFETAFSGYNSKTPEGQKQISAVILPMIKSIPSQIERSFWVEKLASRLRCSQDAVWQDLKNLNDEKRLMREAAGRIPDADNRPAPKTKREKLLERLLLILFYDIWQIKDLKKSDLGILDFDAKTANIIGKLREYAKSAEIASESGRFAAASDKKFLRKLDADEKDLVNNLVFREEVFSTLSDDDGFDEEFKLCLQSLKRDLLHERLVNIQGDLRQDPNNQKLLEEFQKISIQLTGV